MQISALIADEEVPLQWHFGSRRQTRHGSTGRDSGRAIYLNEADVWLPTLPTDGHVTMLVGWPEAGAPITTTRLQLAGIQQLHARVVRML